MWQCKRSAAHAYRGTALLLLCCCGLCQHTPATAADADAGIVRCAGLSADAPDASIAGWNSSSEQYTFAYLSDKEAGTAAAAGSSPVKLLVKVLVLDDTLLTTLATDKASAEPKVLELAVGDYIVGSSSGASEGEAAAAATGGSSTKAYKNLDQLAATVTSAMSQLVGAAAGGGGSSSSQKKQKTETKAAAGSSRAEQQQQQPDPDHDPLRIGPPRRPMRIGEWLLWRTSVVFNMCLLARVVSKLLLGLSCERALHVQCLTGAV
jgi:hypothetical protein